MKVQITNGMFVALIVNLVYTKGIGLTQGILARQIGNDMWISTSFGIIQGIIVMLLTVWLIKRMPSKNLIEHGEILFGKWLSKIIGAIVFLFFIGAYSSIMVTYVYHIKDYFAPDAPVLLPIVVAVIVGLYAVFKGLEVIGRFALIGLFAVFIFNILMILGTFDKFDYQELLPVMSSGFLKNITTSIHYDSEWAMTTMMAAMLLPRIKDSKTWWKAGLAGSVFSGFVILLWPILEIGALSPELTSQYIVACMQLARAAEIGMFIQRYEMIMVAFFSISLYTQIMLIIFLASLTVTQTFNLKSLRPTFLPVALVLNGVGYWVIFDHTRAMTFLTYVWPYFAVTIAVGLPAILFMSGFILKRKMEPYRDTETTK